MYPHRICADMTLYCGLPYCKWTGRCRFEGDKRKGKKSMVVTSQTRLKKEGAVQ